MKQKKNNINQLFIDQRGRLFTRERQHWVLLINGFNCLGTTHEIAKINFSGMSIRK